VTFDAPPRGTGAPEKAPAGNRPWAWALLLLAAFLLRLAYVLRGHPAFGTDELTILNHVHAWADGRVPDEILTLHKAMDLRLWIPAFFYRVWGPSGDPLGAIFLGLLGPACWILWVRRVGGARVAWGMAVFLVLATPAVAYYGTLLSEFRTSLLVGALLALNAGKWGKNLGTAWGLGFLAAFGVFSDLFTLFFLLAVIGMELLEREVGWTVHPWTKVAGLLAGCCAGSWLGLYYLSSLPLQQPGTVHASLAPWGSVQKNFGLLWEVFPVFWAGGFPYGYLQNSPLGRSFNGADGTLGQWMDRILVFAGFLGAFWGVRGWARDSAVGWRDAAPLWVPTVAFTAFFLFSSQTWDALSFRYLYFLLVFWAAGWGCLWVRAAKPASRALIGVALGLLVCGHAYRWRNLTGGSPAVVLVSGLTEDGETRGFANHWVAALLNYGSRDKLRFEPYDAAPGSKSLDAEIRASNRITLVWVEGLDRPEVFQAAVSQLKGIGYRQTGGHPRPGGWGTLDFSRPSGHREKAQGNEGFGRMRDRSEP